MKSLMQWISRNLALTLLFSVELFYLVLISYGIINMTFRKDESNYKYVPLADNILIVAEENYRGLVWTEVETFTESQIIDFEVFFGDRQTAVEKFVDHDNSILILSSNLEEWELAEAHIDESRLPLTQTINDTINSGIQRFVFIHDNVLSVNESRIVSFFANSEMQDLVYQRYKHRAGSRIPSKDNG